MASQCGPASDPAWGHPFRLAGQGCLLWVGGHVVLRVARLAGPHSPWRWVTHLLQRSGGRETEAGLAEAWKGACKLLQLKATGRFFLPDSGRVRITAPRVLREPLPTLQPQFPALGSEPGLLTDLSSGLAVLFPPCPARPRPGSEHLDCQRGGAGISSWRQAASSLVGLLPELPPSQPQERICPTPSQGPHTVAQLFYASVYPLWRVTQWGCVPEVLLRLTWLGEFGL